MAQLDSKIPSGPLADKWRRHKAIRILRWVSDKRSTLGTSSAACVRPIADADPLRNTKMVRPSRRWSRRGRCRRNR